LAEYAPDIESRLHYIGVPVPTEIAVPEDDSRGFTILAASRLHAVKGVRYLIEAFAAALSGMPGATLAIAGDGPDQRVLKELAGRLGVFHAVSFLGHLGVMQTAEQMLKAHIFAQHNVRLPDGAEEALGGSILEASAYGLPVVATRSGGIPEAVLDGKTGILVQPKDVDAMASAFVALYNDPDARRRLGYAGRLFVQERHNASVQDARLAELLTSVCPG
jgi:glycosyltransferase involved in cell wall biosynthesis